jgi:hypothetical protein
VDFFGDLKEAESIDIDERMRKAFPSGRSHPSSLGLR